MMAGMIEAGMRKRWRMRRGNGAMTEAAAQAAALLGRQFGLHPLAARLLVGRGLDDAERAERFLTPKLSDLHDPGLMPGLERAAARLSRAVRQRQPIVIYGDYDVDGVTASAILWHVLRLAGAAVATYVPHRIDEGYGLNCEAIAAIAALEPFGEQRGVWEDAGIAPDAKPLIVSVDCGITAVEPAATAVQCGCDLIITDHHEFDAQALPQAFALVHPRLGGASLDGGGAGGGGGNGASAAPYPFPDLCGAGVAFKLAWQFVKIHCGSQRAPAVFRALLLDLLSLAALGTVADVAPLVGENRVLVTFGLGQIKRTSIIGLNALIDAAKLRAETVDAYHAGFILGPRLNACGRMGHAKEAVRLLTEADADEARELATFLTRENERRRSTERGIFHEAQDMVLAGGYDRVDQRAIVLGKEGWHPGVVGIVASRLVERFGRPVVMLNCDNGMAHGSARSVESVSIHEALCACREHLDHFGGHAMAAGLHLATDRIEIFREALVQFVNARLAPDELVGVIDIDDHCTGAEVDVTVFDQIARLAPFGRGNPAPKLRLGGVTLAETPRRIGKDGSHLSLNLRATSGGGGGGGGGAGGGTGGPNRWIRAVAFGWSDMAGQLQPGMGLDVVFEPKSSEWQGVRRAEVHVQDMKAIQG
jgi:single-stranded-DNA-specific exonuclease